MSNYWRSVDELENSPEFKDWVEREFPVAASEFPTSVSRRRWMHLMGASFAFAGVAGCRWEDEKIATFVERPEGRVPGVPQKYSTMLTRSGYAYPATATSYDGRPVKLDGNVTHPASGGSDAYLQAAVLGLYDPDRASRDVETGCFVRSYDPENRDTLRERLGNERLARPWEIFSTDVSRWMEEAAKKQGANVRVLSEAIGSPTLKRLRGQFLDKYPQAKWIASDALSDQGEQDGLKLAFGQPAKAIHDLSEAKVILCLDADILGGNPEAVKLTQQWAEHRDPDHEMNRVYTVESQFSVTGGIADHRLPLQSGRIASFLRRLAKLVEEGLGGKEIQVKGEEKIDRILTAVAGDLVANQGKGVICVGASQPPMVHAAAAHLNERLGNVGKTVTYVSPVYLSGGDELPSLIEEMKSGSVDVLFILGGNPVYTTPSELQFKEALKSVEHSVHLSLYDDETSDACRWHLPCTHDLEAWGDGVTADGTYTLQQPLITPFHYGRSVIEFVSDLVNDTVVAPYDLVKSGAREYLGGDLSDKAWRRIVHDGFSSVSVTKSVGGGLSGEARSAIGAWLNKSGEPAEQSMEIVFTPGEATYDGRFANNGWLQETPDRLTKLTWDNAAILSPKTADELGVEHADVIEVSYRDRKLELPVYVLPGQAYNSIGVALGYGRTLAGHVGGSTYDGVDPVGVNAYELLPQGKMFDYGVSVKSVGKKAKLAVTQDHHAIDTTGMEEIADRIPVLVREGTLDEYNEHHDFAQHRSHVPPLESLWEERAYDEGYQWGMSIDLNRCIGCNGCMVACQSENNIPVVGKEQIIAGREMHWLRIDRYFAGRKYDEEKKDYYDDIDDPTIVTQPVACHHCENAPCEQVCPVAATVHSEEGLNDMAYNRCIGTRYCANNCPYKVRRFNYFSYSMEGVSPLNEFYNADATYKPEKELVQLVINPEVTVRTRGVMEKCTYCVQRIQNTKIKAKNEGRRKVRDGEIQTACQEACPANAIEFGDINNKDSKVAKAHASDRAYAMLAELNVKPRTKFLARIRNPHPELKEAFSYLHDHQHHGGGHGHGEHGDDNYHGEEGNGHDGDKKHDDKAKKEHA